MSDRHRLRQGPISLPFALVRHQRLMIAVPLVVLAIFAAVSIVRGPVYAARSSFTPEQSDNASSRFAGLAAQFGIPIGGTAVGNPVRFYAELLTSRDLLRDAALTKYRVGPDPAPNPSGGVDLITFYHVSGKTDGERLEHAIRRLARNITVGTYLDAGVVRLTTSAPSPELSEQINRRLLDLVNEFNVERRRTRAGAERQFVEGRLEVARGELTTAEGALRRFLDQNRQYQTSPQLSFEEARLQREVDLRQQVYTSLAQSYEQARIEEVRNTAVITLIVRPEGTGRPSGHILLDGLIWLLLGLGAAAVLALSRELLPRYRAEHPELFEEFRRPWSTKPATSAPPRSTGGSEANDAHGPPRSVSARVD